MIWLFVKQATRAEHRMYKRMFKFLETQNGKTRQAR